MCTIHRRKGASRGACSFSSDLCPLTLCPLLVVHGTCSFSSSDIAFIRICRNIAAIFSDFINRQVFVKSCKIKSSVCKRQSVLPALLFCGNVFVKGSCYGNHLSEAAASLVIAFSEEESGDCCLCAAGSAGSRGGGVFLQPCGK